MREPATPGRGRALSLHAEPAGNPGTPVDVCVSTSTGDSYRLAISTSDVAGFAPFDITYAPD